MDRRNIRGLCDCVGGMQLKRSQEHNSVWISHNHVLDRRAILGRGAQLYIRPLGAVPAQFSEAFNWTEARAPTP